MDEVVRLCQQLIQLDTRNPGRTEEKAADLVAERLQTAGCKVDVHEFEPGRRSVVVRIEGDSGTPLGMTGHLDTVPLGSAPWSVDPFAAEIDGDRLYGRGSSDMKAGVAAMIVAVERLLASDERVPSLELSFTAGEETGSQGARSLAKGTALAPHVGALLVAEPTSNLPVVAHKGVLWLRLTAQGKTAHASMPELGKNAIYTLAEAILALRDAPSAAIAHPVLGSPTSNVGTVSGGLNTNSVPDRADAMVDLRTVPAQDHAEVVASVKQLVGTEITVETVLDLPGVDTSPDDPFIVGLLDILTAQTGEPAEPRGASYFTDASVLTPRYGGPPTVILGPGDPALAHQTDEYCSIQRMQQAVEIYVQVARRWARRDGD